MVKRLQTDMQFERALHARSTVYARRRHAGQLDHVGALDAFNPIFVTLSGARLFRDDYEFIMKSP
ncbi:hypothetical protein [Paenibacillus sp.]|uniref:hypothetical protein n=1 Tax=Paenibacillus sp. TaxID=58172 RepID=UPI002D44C397|nr:hypothetical protein [Paenibacillus sp.]HZG87221.1 hypothetical protein [Paenibacillus sp.]